jgi:hypothetical protein
MSAMLGERPSSRKTEVALAIANGRSVAASARGNEVSKQTAYRSSSAQSRLPRTPPSLLRQTV